MNSLEVVTIQTCLPPVQMKMTCNQTVEPIILKFLQEYFKVKSFFLWFVLKINFAINYFFDEKASYEYCQGWQKILKCQWENVF